MKNKALRTFCVMLVLLGLMLIGSRAGGDVVTHRASVVPLRPGLAAELKAKGKASPELLFPLGVNRGRRFAAPDGEPLGVLHPPAEVKALVILVEFSDTTGTYAPQLFDDMILGTSFDPPGNEVTLPNGTVVHGPTDRTLADYLDEISYGAVTTAGSIVGWVQVDHPYSYYCNATYPNWWGFGYYPANVQGLVQDAVMAADAAGLEFSQFDTVDPYDRNNNGNFFEPDGWVDNLFIVHTGSGAEWTGQEDVIWSHSWDMTEDDFGTDIPALMVDGVQIMDYSMEPEYNGFPIAPDGSVTDPWPPTVGVYAHEFAHVLGLPDEYDYGYESQGTGDWSVMSGGSWAYYTDPMLPRPYYYRFLGNSPTHPSAWGKVRLGFVDPVEVPAGGLDHVTLAPVEGAQVIYKLEVPFSNGTEYFLAENRQQLGFDQGMRSIGAAAHGLLVYHIDENVLQEVYGRPNEAECWVMNNANCTKVAWNGQTHYGISLEQADGRFELEKGKNYGDPGDAFPGVTRNRTFSATSTPNSSSFYFWSGVSPVPGTSGVRITNIQESAGTIQADLGYDAQGRW